VKRFRADRGSNWEWIKSEVKNERDRHVGHKSNRCPARRAAALDGVVAVVLDRMLRQQGTDRAPYLWHGLVENLRRGGLPLPITATTPYVNTIPVEEQAPFPGDRATEHRIKSLIRWNAMAMVVNANRKHSGLGGTSRPSRRRPRSTKWGSTISSGAATATGRRT
jgi:hypothetical protein